MLTRDTFMGPWAGLPVAWTNDDRFVDTSGRCYEEHFPEMLSEGETS